MMNKLIPEQIAPDEHKLLLARIKTLTRALMAAADCIDELALTAVNATATINKLYEIWDKLEALENQELED